MSTVGFTDISRFFLFNYSNRSHYFMWTT